MSSSQPYRPDIDGLRAIAVIAVVLYHADVPGFGGGFVGVDIFFVISGYLITKIIAERVESGTFSFIEFYERRARRILPALFVMLAACAAAAPFILIPDDHRAFLRSLVASVLFVSNMLFARETSYFSETNHYDPLLHTWSLAVEEQFYIIFPAVVIVGYAICRKRLDAAIGVVALASFALSVWLTAYYPRIAFFVAPTRAWELLLGSLIALGALPTVRDKRVRDALGGLGLAMVGGSIALISGGGDFPGYIALYPALGAALIIHAGLGGTTAVGRMLGWRSLVFIGLVSYSLYLWHWPLILFARYVAIRPLAWLETAGVVLLSLVVSVASWWIVERPFRRADGVVRRTGLFGGVGALTAAFVGMGVFSLHEGRGLPGYADIQTAEAVEPLGNPDRHQCLGGLADSRSPTPDRLRGGDLCRLGDTTSATPSFLFWGDSHAEALRAGVDMAAKSLGISGYFAGTIGCPPTIDTRTIFENREYGDCPAMNDAILELAEDPGIDTVILHARWAFYFNGTRLAGEQGPDVRLQSAKGYSLNKKILSDNLIETVSQLSRMNKNIVIVAGVPEIGANVPSVLARQEYFGRKSYINVTQRDYMDRNKDFENILSNISQQYGVRVLYPYQVLCQLGSCKLSENGRPIYLDDDHLSVIGARLLAPMFNLAFDRSRPPIP